MEEKYLKAYSLHADALFRYCFFKIGDRELAQDLLQDAFLKTWRYMTEGHEITNMKSFLYRTVGNLVIDEYRKKKAISLDVMREEGFDYSLDTKESIEEQQEAAAAIHKIKEIPESYRTVIFMRYVEGFSVNDIAEALSQSPNSISVKIHRGMALFRKLYNHE